MRNRGPIAPERTRPRSGRPPARVGQSNGRRPRCKCCASRSKATADTRRPPGSVARGSSRQPDDGGHEPMQESEALSVRPPDTGEALISARNLVKRFGDFTAVDGIDVDVHRGESFGFLGPNGAGKSSTMRMIGCVSPVTDGELTIFGMDPARDGKQIRARIGVVPQSDQLDEQLTVMDNLVLYGRYFDLPRSECRRRAAELLEFVQLTDRAGSRIEPLSGGMKRRVSIA